MLQVDQLPVPGNSWLAATTPPLTRILRPAFPAAAAYRSWSSCAPADGTLIWKVTDGVVDALVHWRPAIGEVGRCPVSRACRVRKVRTGARRRVEGGSRTAVRAEVVAEVPLDDRAGTAALDVVVDMAGRLQGGLDPAEQALRTGKVRAVSGGRVDLRCAHRRGGVGGDVLLVPHAAPPPDPAAIPGVLVGPDRVEEVLCCGEVGGRSGDLVGPYAGQRPPGDVVVEVAAEGRVVRDEPGIDVVDHLSVGRATGALVRVHDELPELCLPPEVGVHTAFRAEGVLGVNLMVAVGVEVLLHWVPECIDIRGHGGVCIC